MKTLPFKKSDVVSIGMELEFQIIDLKTFSLVSRAKELLRKIRENKNFIRIKPEVTQSMIEINSSIHHSPKELMKEMVELQGVLLRLAEGLNISFCGGGTHPFQKWTMQKIFPTERYKKLSRMYRYLSKRSTVFGQHIHIGCKSAEDALYLTHALGRFVPQLIAISASSPFYQGIDTGYFSSRSTIFNAFPLSGFIPFFLTWPEFSEYFYKMRNLGIIETMKDFYWDIRPKPEFGTVEIRVLDCPLTVKKAVLLTAYVQALALYILEERPIKITQDLYYVYNYNRFQASRYGYEGHFIDPTLRFQTKLIRADIEDTIKKIEHAANTLKTMGYIMQVLDDVMNDQNDSRLLRQLLKQSNSFQKVVEKQCELWRLKK